MELCDIFGGIDRALHPEAKGGPGEGLIPGNLCEVTPTSAIDCTVVRNLCPDSSRAARLCQAEGGAGPVQTDMGQRQVAGGAQVIPGSIAYYPCPSPIPWHVQIRLAELRAGCCHTDYHHDHQGHGHSSCACGTHPCSC